MSPKTMRLLAKPMLLAAALIWGTSFFIMKNTLDAVPVFFLFSFRFTAGAVLLGLIAWKRWRSFTPDYLWRGAVIGGFLFLAYSIQTFGLARTTSSKNAFLTAVYCVIVPFLTWAVMKVRPDRYNIAAALLCVTGVGLVSLTEELTVKNNRVEVKSAEIILDTLAIGDMAEGVDYTLSYNFSKGAAVVQFINTPTTETVTCSYNTVDASMVDAADILGKETEEGEYTGLHAMSLLYQYCNAVLDILAAPGWSHNPEIYRAMVNTVTKLNGHWDGFVNADIPLEDADGNPIDTMEKAKKWAEANAYNNERSKVYWPKVKDGTGRVFHLSTVGSATMLRVDLSHNGVPFESPSNKAIMATGQYFGESSKNRGYDQQKANTLNEFGITTACFWGGQWVLWGPHTAAYKYEDSITGNMDARAIFDVNLRMLMYITNQFQIDHGTEIDAPLTPTDKDTILNDEKRRLDNLKGIGALIGTPSVAFLESANSVNQMMNGDFVWDFTVTNTPPLKSATARVCYTDEGFNAFFESE